MVDRLGRWAARGVAVFCGAFALYQLAIALGVKLGAVGPGGVVTPMLRAASTGAAIYLLVACLAMFVRAGDFGRHLAQWPFRALNVFLIFQFAANTVLNLQSPDPTQRTVMCSATLTGLVLAVFAALPKGGPAPAR